MHPAQAMIQGAIPPSGATLIGYIDRHPSDDVGLGYAILFFAATGIEAAWDGQSIRNLPNGWRSKVNFVGANQAAELGRRGGLSASKTKIAASRANGKKGGRPRQLKKSR